jgi:hypothetical protein
MHTSTAAFSHRMRHPNANVVLREMTKETPCIFRCFCGFFLGAFAVTKSAYYPHHGSWVGTRVGGGRDLTNASRPPGDLPSLLHKIYRVFFSRGKAAEAWRQPPSPSSAQVTERVQYTSTPPLSLHGLSQGELYLYLHPAPPSVRSMGADPTERISVKFDIWHF